MNRTLSEKLFTPIKTSERILPRSSSKSSIKATVNENEKCRSSERNMSTSLFSVSSPDGKKVRFVVEDQAHVSLEMFDDKGSHFRRGKGALAYTPSPFLDNELDKFKTANQALTKLEYETRHSNEKLDSVSPNAKWFFSCSNSIGQALSNGVQGFEKIFTSVDQNDRWLDYFGRKLNTTLEKALSCFLLSEPIQKQYYGELFISHSHLCFFTAYDALHSLWVCIPWTSIKAITKAGRKYHHDKVNGRRRGKSAGQKNTEVIPLQDTNIKPSVIQFWTDKGEVHQFYGFGNKFDDTFDIIMGLWNEMTIT